MSPTASNQSPWLPSGYLTVRHGKWPIYRWFSMVYLLNMVDLSMAMLVITRWLTRMRYTGWYVDQIPGKTFRMPIWNGPSRLWRTRWAPLAKHFCGGEHGAFSIEKFAGSAWGNNWHNQCISRLWSCLSLHRFVRNLQYINAINPTLPFCQAPLVSGHPLKIVCANGFGLKLWISLERRLQVSTWEASRIADIKPRLSPFNILIHAGRRAFLAKQ